MKCPEHRVEYEPSHTSYEQLGIILKDVEALRCPIGGELLFTLEQAERMRERIAMLAPRLKLTRKITRAGRKPFGLVAVLHRYWIRAKRTPSPRHQGLRLGQIRAEIVNYAQNPPFLS